MTDPSRVEQALEQFLVAFRNLEWAPFLAAFTEDASVFFPFPEQPRLASGKAAIAAVFQPFFAQARLQHPAGPPYLALLPIDLDVVIDGATALATFHIQDPGMLCRRSVFLRRHNGAWLIRHLHASNIHIAAPLDGTHSFGAFRE